MEESIRLKRVSIKEYFRISVFEISRFDCISVFSPVFGDSGDTYAAIGCDVGWVNANNYCYLFTTTRAVTWQEAADECDTYDSSLLYFDIFDYAVDEKVVILKLFIISVQLLQNKFALNATNQSFSVSLPLE